MLRIAQYNTITSKEITYEDLRSHNIAEFIDLTDGKLTGYHGYIKRGVGVQELVIKTDKNKIITYISEDGWDLLYHLIRDGIIEKVEEIKNTDNIYENVPPIYNILYPPPKIPTKTILENPFK